MHPISFFIVMKSGITSLQGPKIFASGIIYHRNIGRFNALQLAVSEFASSVETKSVRAETAHILTASVIVVRQKIRFSSCLMVPCYDITVGAEDHPSQLKRTFRGLQLLFG